MSEHQDRSRNALQKAAEASFLAWCEELKADQAQFLSEKILCLGCMISNMATVFEKTSNMAKFFEKTSNMAKCFFPKENSKIWIYLIHIFVRVISTMC